jgi:acyl carrier protein
MSSHSDALIKFIKDEILHGRAVALDEDQDLLGAGIVDSLGILRLVAFMEQRFGITVPDEDVVYENFQNVKAMAEYVAQRQEPRRPPVAV